MAIQRSPFSGVVGAPPLTSRGLLATRSELASELVPDANCTAPCALAVELDPKAKLLFPDARADVPAAKLPALPDAVAKLPIAIEATFPEAKTDDPWARLPVVPEAVADDPCAKLPIEPDAVVICPWAKLPALPDADVEDP